MLNIGGSNISAINQSAGFVPFNTSSGNDWVIKIKDIRYNSTNYTKSSLNDTFTRDARLDTAFPGIAVPQSLWLNVQALFDAMELPENSTLDCNQTVTFIGENFKYCAINTTCNMSLLANISL
jgi:hypothetical protein